MGFEDVTAQYLKASRIKFSRKLLNEQLKAHPDYPALNSLTDMLDDWGMEYSALQLEPDDLRQMAYPFLAHIITQNGYEDFKIVRNHKQVQDERSDFLKSWTGVALWIAPESPVKNDGHVELIRKEQTMRWLKGIIPLIFIGALATLFFRLNELNSLIFSLMSLAGIIVSGSIVAYNLGVDNRLTRSFCKIEESGCHQVINSGFSRILPGIHLDDMALLYFGSLLLFQLFTVAGFETYLLLVALPVLVSGLVSLASLGYQLVHKTWCKLCLLLNLVIWSQLAFSLLNLPKFSITSIVPPLSEALLAISLASCWLLIRPLVEASKRVTEQDIRIRKWRQDPRWFQALLPLHKAIDRSIWDKELFLGNPRGALQITLASGPYCVPCAMAHRQLGDMLERFPKDIGLRLRFAVKETNTKDIEAVTYLLHLIEEQVWSEHGLGEVALKKILDDWFDQQNLDEFSERYTISGSNGALVEELVAKHINWRKQFQIDQTPGFFVNGHEMPNPHTLQDLDSFLEQFIENIKTGPSSTNWPVDAAHPFSK